jgi:hypothetical protein
VKALETKSQADKLVSIERIVVAVDLTKHSEATANYAAQIAKCFNASLYVVHVFTPAPLHEFESEGAYSLIEQQRKEFRAQLNDLTEQVRTLVPACEPVFLRESRQSKYQRWHARWMLIWSSPPAIIQRFSAGCSTWKKQPKLCTERPARS